MTVQADSALVLQRHAKTFSLAARFLPADRREDAAVLYALCRAIDDAADEATDAQEAVAALAAMRRELQGEAPPRPLIATFHALADRRGMSIAPVLHLLDAVAGDLGPVRLAEEGDLVRYGYGVAGTVGLLMCGVLGVSRPAAAAHAVDLGVAMQISNICRDVLEDARRGRVYLPERLLRAAGTDPDALLEERAPAEAVARVVRHLVAVADRYYASGEAGLRYLPLRSRVAILVAARVYRAIGLVLVERGADPLRGRTVVPPFRKVLEVARALATWPFLPRRAHDAGLHAALAGLPGAHAEAVA